MGLFIGVAMGPGIDGSVSASQPIVVVPQAQAPGDEKVTASSGVPSLGAPSGGASRPIVAPSSPTGVVGGEPVPVPSAQSPEPAQPATAAPAEEPAEPAPEPAPEPGLLLAGTVVHVNPLARSYSLASKTGQMSAIHANKPPKLGDVVEVKVRELANGTYGEQDKRVVSASRTRAKLGGVVTFSDPEEHRFTVSRRGVSVLVDVDPAGTPELTVPAVGALVVVAGRFETVPEISDGPEPSEPAQPEAAPPEDCGVAPQPPAAPATIFRASEISIDTEFLGYSDFAGIVQGICAGSGSLVLSADDLRASGEDIRFTIGAEVDVNLIDIGDIVDVSAVIDEQTSALELTGISLDRGLKQADDAGLVQGDQAG